MSNRMRCDVVVNQSYNWQFCKFSGCCPAESMRLKTRIAPRSHCSDNPGVEECVVYKACRSLGDKWWDGTIGKELHLFWKGMSDEFSRLSNFLGDEYDKRVIRERWDESCRNVEVLS